MKKNVLFVTNIPAPYRVYFFSCLARKVNLTVVFENKTDKERENDWLNSEKITFSSYFLCEHEHHFSFLKKIITNNDFDEIIIGNYSTKIERRLIIYLRAKKIPYWISSDGGFIKKDNCLKFFIKKSLLSDAKGYFSSSDLTDKYLINYGAKSEKIFKYPFSSIRREDLNYIVSNDIMKEVVRKYGIDTSKKNIIGIGQITYRKGWDLLLEAAALSKSAAQFYILGGVAQKEQLKIIKKNNLNNVHFIGFSDKVTVYALLSICDLFVLPTREDIWGLVINEAMCKKIPIITTDACMAGLELIANNEAGVVLPLKPEKEFIISLAKCIDSLLNDSEKRAIYVNNAFRIIQKYTIEDMAEAYYRILTNHE